MKLLMILKTLIVNDTSYYKDINGTNVNAMGGPEGNLFTLKKL